MSSILITDDFFLDGHQYPHVVALCDGLASFYEFKYAEALDKFEKVKRLASEATGSSLTARRHAATGLNNMGVCLQVIGDEHQLSTNSSKSFASIVKIDDSFCVRCSIAAILIRNRQ